MFGLADAGGLKSDFDATITAATFDRPATYNQGRTTCLVLTIQPDDGTPEFTHFYPCGPDWVSFDNGKTATHPNPDIKGFNQNARVRQFAARATEDPAAREVLGKRQEAAGGLGPRHSEIWVGLRYHWKIIPQTSTIEGKEYTSKPLYPVAYLGVADGSGAKSAVERTTLSGGGHNVSVPSPLATQIKLLAVSRNFPEFVDGVMEIPGALSEPALTDALGSEDFYQSVRASS